jgi:Putative transposase/Transposase zinc-binding domain
MLLVDRCKLQDVFVAGFERFAQHRDLHPRESEAARCISHCYTQALGTHMQQCLNGDFSRIQYHACRHRSCPQCARDAREQWLQSQLPRLLPCPHAHVIFTLPHVLLPLWELNRSRLISVLFHSSRQALLDLMRDHRDGGCTPGILMSLHTWGRNLSYHPHLHCLISAGGVDDNGQWVAHHGKWLLGLKPLEALYRGKVLAALRAALRDHTLQLPSISTDKYWLDELARQQNAQWNVRVCPVYEHGRGVALYLARYAKGGPLPQSKVLQSDGKLVRLLYRDHRAGKRRWLTLPIHQFIERVLWHAPPRGVHTTRHAGLYSTPMREQHANAARTLGVQPKSPAPPTALPSAAPCPPTEGTPPATSTRCPQCGGPMLRHLLHRPHLRPQFMQGLRRENSKPAPQHQVQATGPPLSGPQKSNPRHSQHA